MKAFQLDRNYNLEISPDTLVLGPFKDLIDRDKTKDKEIGKKELLYVYHMEDPRSDFSDIMDEVYKIQQITTNIRFPKGWKEDKLVTTARKFYKERQETMSIRLYKACKIAVDKIEQFFTKFDIDERDEKGKPIFNISQINGVIKEIGTTIDNLEKLEQKVKRDLSVKNNVRGSKTKSHYEDGV